MRAPPANPNEVGRFLRAIAAMVVAAAGFSCASPPPASRAPLPPPTVRVAPLPPPSTLSRAQPAPDISENVPTPPVSSAPPASPPPPPAEPPSFGPPPPGPIPPRAAEPSITGAKGRGIALVLPLKAAAYARAADAVRSGFLDAAASSSFGADILVIGHDEDGVLPALAEAAAKDVRVIVGPLVRDDLKTVAIAEPDLPWTLALNQLDDGTRLPRNVSTLALTVEGDARQIARRAREDGAKRVDVIEGESPLMHRFAAAFALEWTDAGGRAPTVYRFDPSPEALTAMRRSIQRSPPDALLLAVDGERAALVKPFLGGLVTYASGLVFERPDPAFARDLDDVRIVEIPWIVTPDAPQFDKLPKKDLGGAALTRLYALGIDAFRVARAIHDGPPDRFELDGATGHITWLPGRGFLREGVFAVYRDGQLLALDAAP
jgi:outer membrane PBP1 activator LpoA protein